MAGNWMTDPRYGYGYSDDYYGGTRNAGRGGSNVQIYGGYDERATEDNMAAKGRSQSLTPESHVPWERSRRQSAPVRWHPQYDQPAHPIRTSASNWTMQSLETIPEDGANHNRNRANMNASYAAQGYQQANETTRRFSHYELTNTPRDASDRHRLYHGRSTSDGSVSFHRQDEDMRRNEIPNNNDYTLADYQNQKEDKKRRRKSQISFDTSSEKDIRNKISDTRSLQSSKSKVSVNNKLSETVSNSPRGSRSTGSKGPRSTTTSRGVHSTPTPGSHKKSNSSRMSDASHLPGNKMNRSVSGESAAGTKVTFAESPLDIPVELLDLRRPSFRKVLRPIAIALLVITLIVSLFVAVYFAAALKESQERQIEFLQATLEFSLSQNQRSRDYSSLTDSETQSLKSSYCRQVDAWYRGSTLTNEYRGCQLDVLRNDRIEFTLFFLDERGPPKGAVEIMSILENRAEQEGQEGQSLVTISDVVIDLSPSKSNVDLAVTSKPKDFIGVNSRDDQPKEGGIRIQKVETTTVPTTTMTTIRSTTTLKTTTTITSQNLEDTVLSKDICRSIKVSEVVAHPFSCGHFIQCEFGTPIARPCSGGLVFDPEGRACVKPNANLPCTEIKPCENVNGGYFAHPTDCRLYEICDQGKAVMMSCPPGLIWDVTSQNCVPRKRGTQCQTHSPS